MEDPIKNYICISNYFKGNDFLINMKKLGNRVYLITSDKLRDKPWAFDYIDEIEERNNTISENRKTTVEFLFTFCQS